MEDFKLNTRQSNVLKLLVREYISKNQPISSLYLTENFSLGCSSATIRSVFKYLEDNGFVYSPHRSSGRVPSEKAYRFYVSAMEPETKINEKEQKLIQAEYLKNGLRLMEILDTTGRVLSLLTDYATVIMGPAPDQSMLKHIELIDMGQDEILIILVTRSGTVFSRTVYLENRIPGEFLHLISNRLNEMFKGMDLSHIRDQINNITSNDKTIRKYIPVIGKAIHDNFEAVHGGEKMFIHGLENLFSHFTDNQSTQTAKIRHISELFESKDFLTSILDKTVNLDNCRIHINGDNDIRLSGLSVITAGYKMGDQQVGAIGIVGPNRMDYNRVISLVEYMRILMSNMITRITN